MSWVISFLGGAFFSPLIEVALGPLLREAWRTMNSIVQNQMLDIEDVVSLYFRGVLTGTQTKARLLQYGYSEDEANLLIKARERLPTLTQLVTLKWRKEIDEETFHKMMRAIGFPDKLHDLIEKSLLYYPSPSDIIRFAIREAYNPEVIRKYGYDQDMPEEYLEEAKKAGLSEEFAKRYWFAHWELPSLTAGFEMLHRLNFKEFEKINPKVAKKIKERYVKMGLDPNKLDVDLDVIKTLVRLHDYPPYWRDRLVAISYYPLTRVDLRRIYEMGLITRDELKMRLMEYGYTAEDAELMCKFYDAYRMSEERKLTKTNINKLLKYREISPDEAVKMLMEIGYDKESAEFIVLAWLHDIFENELDEFLDVLKKKYALGRITIEECRKFLTSLNLPESRIEAMLNEIELYKQKNVRTLSKEDIIKAYKKRIFKKDEAITRLEAIGYSKEDAEILLKIG